MDGDDPGISSISGWTRGEAYRSPDMARTCCPQYTIRLDITEFKATKKHRQVTNRFNRYLDEGEKPGESSTGQALAVKGGKGKGKAPEWDLLAELKKHEEGWGISGSKHKYTVSGRRGLAHTRRSWFPPKLPQKRSSCTRSIRWPYTRTRRKRSPR